VLATGDDPLAPLLSDLISLYRRASLDVKRYALVMGQRAGPGIEPTAPADSDDEILVEPLLRDEVDDLVAAWRAQRPDLDVEPMQVLSRISRLARHLDIARRGAFAEHELESWAFDVLSALRRQGPPFQLTPGALLRATLVSSGTMTNRIDRLARHLDIARRGAFAEHELESWAFDVLSALRRQGPPFQLTPGALLRATLVTSGTMTNRIDRLAAEGLVRREPDPRDKRGVLVILTDQGQERVDAALAGLLRRERALLAGLDDTERRHLADLMRILLAPFDAAE
jgi:DNA-binding MarR family transcriptional regulator